MFVKNHLHFLQEGVPRSVVCEGIPNNGHNILCPALKKKERHKVEVVEHYRTVWVGTPRWIWRGHGHVLILLGYKSQLHPGPGYITFLLPRHTSSRKFSYWVISAVCSYKAQNDTREQNLAGNTDRVQVPCLPFFFPAPPWMSQLSVSQCFLALRSSYLANIFLVGHKVMECEVHHVRARYNSQSLKQKGAVRVIQIKNFSELLALQNKQNRSGQGKNEANCTWKKSKQDPTQTLTQIHSKLFGIFKIT